MQVIDVNKKKKRAKNDALRYLCFFGQPVKS